MADVKISALPAATTPLAGTELVPIVQSGATSQVSVANMTAGRTVSASTVLIGTTTQRTIAGQTTEFLIERPAASRAALVRNTNDANGPIVFTAKSRGTTNGSYTVVASGDALGTWNFAGSDGTADVIAASIRADVDGTPGASDMPGRLVFSTTADGASSPTERMRIASTGNVAIGTVPAASTRLMVAGPTNNPQAAATDGGINQYMGYCGFGSAYSGTSSNHPYVFLVNNSERMRIDTAGNVGIGTASPVARLEIINTSASHALFQLTQNNTSFNADMAFYNAANILSATLISKRTDGGLWLYQSGPNYIAAFTNAVERMRITATGNVVAGGSVALATTATDGFLYVPTCAGVPTGTPTAITGMAPIVVNTTNNKLYFYSGGAWRDAGP